MLTLNKFKKKYKHHINMGLSYDRLGRLRNYVNFDFDVFLSTRNMNLQRGNVWNFYQKQSLIIAILRNQEIPPITVIQHNTDNIDSSYKWQVIDGKQRLTTLFDYLDNKFQIEIDNENYYYNDLPEDCQKQIFNYSLIKLNVHYSYDDEPINDQTKIELFEEINWLGTPQDIEHLNKLKQ